MQPCCVPSVHIQQVTRDCQHFIVRETALDDFARQQASVRVSSTLKVDWGVRCTGSLLMSSVSLQQAPIIVEEQLQYLLQEVVLKSTGKC